MRILVVSSYAAPLTGGAAVVYDQIARAMPGVALLAPSLDYEDGTPIPGVAAFDAAAPYPVVRVPLLRPLVHGWRSPFDKLQTLWRMAATLAAVARAARRHRAEAVCIGDLISLGWLVWPVRRLLRLPALLYVHGEEATYADRSIFHRWRGKALNAADRVVAVSSFTAGLLHDRYGVPHERVDLVPNGVDTRRFHPDPVRAARLRAVHGVGERPLVVALSRLVPRKGFDVLVEAMALVSREVPDARCLIAGQGEMAPRLQAAIDRLGLQDAVTLTGPVADADIVALYSAGTLFAMPNRTLANGDTEGFGLVFLEAAACGTPSVGGRAGGAVDAIDDGETGYLVESEDPRAVADAIVRILHDPVLRERLSQGALRRAAVSTWGHAAERFAAACGAAKRSFSSSAGTPT